MKPDINTVGGLMPSTRYEGQLTRLSEEITDSVVNSGATTVSPGQPVGRDPSNPRCGRLAISTDEIVGISLRDPVTYHADSSGNVGFAQYRSIPFLRFGYCGLTPIEQVHAGEGLVAIFSSETGAFTGWGSTAGGISSTRRLMNGHKWETDTAAEASEPGEVSAISTGTVNYVTY